MYSIKNVSLFDGETIQENKIVHIDKGKIVQILNESEKSMVQCLLDGQGQLLIPGFVDIQVNGGGGIFFNNSPTLSALNTIQKSHLKFGTTSILPTMISDEFSVMKAGCLAVQEAMAQNSPGILGIHLEGPFLNVQKKGIHQANHIQMPTKMNIHEICHFKIPIKLVTLAPEVVPKIFLSELHQNGVTIFAGHTNATFEEIENAHKIGLKGITHFFNACSQMLSRAPGVVGFGLLNNDIWCSLIADGYHIDFNSLKVALKCKQNNKIILVSDSMAPFGTDCKEFILQDQKITIQNGKYIDENGVLAGSSCSIYEAFKNILSLNCIDFCQALSMTSTNAARCLQIDHRKGKVCVGYDADLILWDRGNSQILKVIQAGVIQPHGKN